MNMINMICDISKSWRLSQYALSFLEQSKGKLPECLLVLLQCGVSRSKSRYPISLQIHKINYSRHLTSLDVLMISNKLLNSMQSCLGVFGEEADLAYRRSSQHR